MLRRPNASRRPSDSDSLPFMDALHPKVHRSPLILGAAIIGALLVVGLLYQRSGGSKGDMAAFNTYGRISCTQELPSLIPLLKKTYGDSMHRVLHVGPESCSIVSHLVKNDVETEAWGIEPYELDDADSNCKNLVQKGVVRVADIKLSLPYKKKSFSLVIVSDAVDYLSPKYLNRTVPELARVSADGFVVLSGYPSSKKSQGSRPAQVWSPGEIPDIFVVDTVFLPSQLGRERVCYQEVRASCCKEVIQTKLPSFPPQVIALIIPNSDGIYLGVFGFQMLVCKSLP